MTRADTTSAGAGDTGTASSDAPVPSTQPRPAQPDEAPGVVDRVRSSIPPDVLPLTPIGQSGASAWVADQIRTSTSVPRFVVSGDALEGIAEWRRIDDALFLNQIYVAPEARRQGIAARLLIDGLHRVPEDTPVRLDVFPTNDVALDWYRRLGFAEIERRCWMTASPPLVPDDAAAVRAVVQGSSSANDTHARYGFSQIDVRLPSGETVRVGRLGDDAFRITSPSLLHNLALRRALHDLDPDRQLVYVGPAPDDVSSGFRVVAQSRRHEALAGSLLARLSADTSPDADRDAAP